MERSRNLSVKAWFEQLQVTVIKKFAETLANRGIPVSKENPTMRRLILQLHLIVALVGGIFIATLGLTGSIMAFETELGRLQDLSIAHVMPHGTPLTLEEIGN